MNKTNKDYQFHIKQCQNETRNKNEKDSKCGICSKKFNRIKYVQKHIRGGLISKAIFTLISSSEKWVKSRVSVQGVESLWGDCRFIPVDWGS